MRNPAPVNLLLAFAVACGFAWTAPARAGVIANLTVTDTSGLGVYLDDAATGVKLETDSSATLVGSNLAATMPTFTARLAAIAAADTEKPYPTVGAAFNARMRINFDVVAAPTESWTMQIGQIRRFALTLVDDPGSGFQSEAFIENQNASYQILPGPAGVLGVPIGASEATNPVFGNVNTPVSAANIQNLVGLGSASVQLDFEQRLRVVSYANLDPNLTIPAPGQEAAVRFGLAGSLPGVTAEDYPGVGGRTLAGDGHFVNVKMTFVPEPASVALIGLTGMALLGRRRSRLP